MTGIRPAEGNESETTIGGAMPDGQRWAEEAMDEKESAWGLRTEEASFRSPRGEGVLFTDLPDECVHLIVSYLNPKDLARGACVCRGFRDTLDSDLVWEQFVCKSARKVVGYNDELKAATNKNIFTFLRKPILLREDVAYWLDQFTGGGCYSLSARGLRVVWGHDSRYWEWSSRPGARWPEVACLREVCWFHVSGILLCELSPGTYTLSWRVQYNNYSCSIPGWDSLPTEFSVSTTDGPQSSTTHRYFTNDAMEQRDLGDLTPVRLVDDRWLEFDAGEITVVDGEDFTSLEFSMVEIESGDWKRGVILDGVVLRPSSVAKITGRYLNLDEVEPNAVQNEEYPLVERLPAGFQGFLGRMGVRRPMRRGRWPQFDAGEN